MFVGGAAVPVEEEVVGAGVTGTAVSEAAGAGARDCVRSGPGNADVGLGVPWHLFSSVTEHPLGKTPVFADPG